MLLVMMVVMMRRNHEGDMSLHGHDGCSVLSRTISAVMLLLLLVVMMILKARTKTTVM